MECQSKKKEKKQKTHYKVKTKVHYRVQARVQRQQTLTPERGSSVNLLRSVLLSFLMSLTFKF